MFVFFPSPSSLNGVAVKFAKHAGSFFLAARDPLTTRRSYALDVPGLVFFEGRR